MIAKVKNFVKESYEQSPLAFFCEMAEATLLISASAVLTYTVLDPATRIFIPLYFVGSCLGIVSTVIRVVPMATILCTWFAVMNLVAMIQLFVL